MASRTRATTAPPPWSGEAPWVIAEVGVNHDGDVRTAERLIDVAADAGADAVKFQAFTAAAVASPAAATAAYQQETAGVRDQRTLLADLELSAQDLERTREHARRRGIAWFATAFDARSCQVVDALEPVAHKIPSGELTNLELVEARAVLGRPLLVSTGMATVDEVDDAVAAAGAAPHLAVLHCVTAYPAPAAAANLLVLPELHRRLRCPVGWSDHTTATTTAVAAVALGATILERHLTLDRDARGPDHAASSDPAGFRHYVEEVREAASALGTKDKAPQPCELANRHLARRSWHAARALPAGHLLDRSDLADLRPAVGVPVSRDVTGRRLRHAVTLGAPILDDDLDP